MILRNTTPHNKNNTLNVFWVGALLIILAIAAPWFNLTVSSPELVKSYIASFGISFLLFLSLYYKLSNSKIHLQINYIKLTLLLLFVFGTCSVFWSVNFDFTVTKWLLWLIAASSFILAVNISTENNSLIKLSWGLMLAAGVIAAIGVLQYLSDPFNLAQNSAPASTFGNKNIAIQPIILILPMSIFLILSKQVQNLKVWTLIIITSLVVVFIFYTTTRSAWLAIIIELFFIALYLITNRIKLREWIDWNKNKSYATIFGILAILLLINLSPNSFSNNSALNDLFVDSSESIYSLTDSVSGQAILSSSLRYEIWQTALNMFYDSPFIGTGLGSYSQNLASEGYATWVINNTTHPHNDLLELAVELGLIGIVIFISVAISLIIGIVKIINNTSSRVNFFYYLLFTALIGSFVNMQFSSPYQMAFPLLLFGLYSGLIAKQVDNTPMQSKIIIFPLKAGYKKIILGIATTLVVIIFYFTYYFWINTYNQLEKINISKDFEQIEIVETPVYYGGTPGILYSLGGSYFKNGRYKESSQIDEQLLKVWPNHLDTLWRLAYAKHKLNQNTKALELATELKELEPQGLYYSYIIKMFVYSSSQEVTKFLETYNELFTQPEEFLKLNNDWYRYLLFFTLTLSDLSKDAPILYDKYIEYWGYLCEVENNIAIHYFKNEKFESSAQHVMNVINRNGDCLNPQLIKLLDEKGLIAIKSD